MTTRILLCLEVDVSRDYLQSNVVSLNSTRRFVWTLSFTCWFWLKCGLQRRSIARSVRDSKISRVDLSEITYGSTVCQNALQFNHSETQVEVWRVRVVNIMLGGEMKQSEPKKARDVVKRSQKWTRWRMILLVRSSSYRQCLGGSSWTQTRTLMFLSVEKLNVSLKYTTSIWRSLMYWHSSFRQCFSWTYDDVLRGVLKYLWQKFWRMRYWIFQHRTEINCRKRCYVRTVLNTMISYIIFCWELIWELL